MRALALLALLGALLCTGCMGSDEKPAEPQGRIVDDGVSKEDAARPVQSLVDPLPTRAALAARPSDELRRRLDAGEVALVDLAGRMEIRPRRIDFAHGGRLEDVEWQRWDDHGAVGTGRMVGVICDPDCGRGKLFESDATIRLSQPVACPRGRFFDRGKVELTPADPELEPSSWLAAPC
jgi:hypothetical protein